LTIANITVVNKTGIIIVHTYSKLLGKQFEGTRQVDFAGKLKVGQHFYSRCQFNPYMIPERVYSDF